MANFKSFFYWGIIPITVGLLIYNTMPKERFITTNGANITMIGSYYISMFLKPILKKFYQLPHKTWQGTLNIPEVKSAVKIYRDELGIPYVLAECDEDLFFAQGYVTALERSSQMTQFIVHGQGRLSEYIGASGLDSDVEMRSLDIVNHAKRSLEHASETLKIVIHHFSRGVAYAFKHMPKQQLEHLGIPLLENWTEIDTATVIFLISLKLNRGWNSEISQKILEQNLSPELQSELGIQHGSTPFVNPEGSNAAMYDLEGNPIEPPSNNISEIRNAYNTFELETASPPSSSQETTSYEDIDSVKNGFDFEIEGSNAWAISGKYTYSGKPLIAGDMHLMQTVPSMFFPIFLSSTNSTIMRKGKSGLKFIGASVPGIPGLMAGHNEYLGLSMTVSYVDSDDLFDVELTEDSKSYIYDGKEVPLLIKEEKLYVKGYKDPVILEVKRTHHGPLITSLYNKGRVEMKPNHALAISNPMFRSNSGFEGVLAISSCNWEEFFKFLTNNNCIELVATWGDTEGNFGSFLVGNVPIRKNGAYPFRDGTTSEHDWQGFYNTSYLPHVMNPTRGYAIAANSVLAPDPENKLGRCAMPGDRQGRVNDILQGYINNPKAPNLTVNDFQIMQMDQYSSNSCFWKNLVWDSFLKDFNEESQLPSDEITDIPYLSTKLAKQLATEIKHWDCIMSSKSKFTAFFDSWFNVCVHLVIENSSLPIPVQNEILGNSAGTNFLHEMGAHAKATFIRHIEHPDKYTALKGVDVKQCIVQSLSQLLGMTKTLYGHPTLALQWDDVQSLFFLHPFSKALPLAHHTVSIGPFNPGGNSGTLHVSRIALNEPSHDINTHQYIKASVGPMSRIIMDTNDWTQSKWLILPGTSGWIASEHYGDQLEYLKAGKLHPMLWKDEDIIKHAVTELNIQPTSSEDEGTAT